MKTTLSTGMSVNLHDYRRAFLHKDLPALRFTYYIFRMLQLPWLVRILSGLFTFALKKRIPGARLLVKNTIYRVFCAGESIGEAVQTIKKLAWYKVGAVLDYVSEAENDDAAFERNHGIILANIRLLAAEAPGNAISVKITGLEDMAFLARISGQGLESMSHADTLRYDRLYSRLDEICNVCNLYRVQVYLDAEDRCMQDLFDHLAGEMMKRYNRGQAVVYNTVQMYLRDRIGYLERLFSEASDKGFNACVKLVRGAYLEKEREHARLQGLPSPVHTSKEDTDRAFDQALQMCLSRSSYVYTCIASHNERSTLLAVTLIAQHGILDHFQKVKFSQLLGMSDNLTFNLAARGYNVSKYQPYGEVEKAIPYLIRRAEENTAVAGQMTKEVKYLKEELSRRRRQRHSLDRQLAQ